MDHETDVASAQRAATDRPTDTAPPSARPRSSAAPRSPRPRPDRSRPRAQPRSPSRRAAPPAPSPRDGAPRRAQAEPSRHRRARAGEAEAPRVRPRAIPPPSDRPPPVTQQGWSAARTPGQLLRAKRRSARRPRTSRAGTPAARPARTRQPRAASEASTSTPEAEPRGRGSREPTSGRVGHRHGATQAAPARRPRTWRTIGLGRVDDAGRPGCRRRGSHRGDPRHAARGRPPRRRGPRIRRERILRFAPSQARVAGRGREGDPRRRRTQRRSRLDQGGRTQAGQGPLQAHVRRGAGGLRRTHPRDPQQPQPHGPRGRWGPAPPARARAPAAAHHRQAHGDHRARRPRPDRGPRRGDRSSSTTSRGPAPRRWWATSTWAACRTCCRAWRPRSSISAADATASCTRAR